MTTTTLTKTVRTLIATGTNNFAGGTTRGTVDLRTTLGGLLTIKILNPGSALGAQAVANILTAHNAGATPAAASAGADWKTLHSVGNGTAIWTIGEWNYRVPEGVMHLEVEVTGNTTSPVTCEAYLSEVSSSVSI